jgi:hypothetical protein
MTLKKDMKCQFPGCEYRVPDGHSNRAQCFTRHKAKCACNPAFTINNGDVANTSSGYDSQHIHQCENVTIRDISYNTTTNNVTHVTNLTNGLQKHMDIVISKLTPTTKAFFLANPYAFVMDMAGPLLFRNTDMPIAEVLRQDPVSGVLVSQSGESVLTHAFNLYKAIRATDTITQTSAINQCIQNLIEVFACAKLDIGPFNQAHAMFTYKNPGITGRASLSLERMSDSVHRSMGFWNPVHRSTAEWYAHFKG